jgi:hypothetical protein
MNTEVRSDFDANYNHHVEKIRTAAAMALKAIRPIAFNQTHAARNA